MPIGFALLANDECRPLQSLDDVAQYWPMENVKLWVDLESPSGDDLQRLGEIVGLDEQALDDCVHDHQRPRVEEFDSYIFLVLYGLYGLHEQEDLDPHKLVAFCGSRLLITIEWHPVLSVRQVRARCGRHPESLLARGVDCVLFSIIDTMVDYYLQVVDRYEDKLEAIEERSFDLDVDEKVLEESADVRRDLIELRRLAVAQRQLLLPIAKGEYDFVSETLSQEVSRVGDHLHQVVDIIDSMRETIVGIRENYHAALTRRTNEIMQVLTVFAAIILPLTLVTGIYGMNLPIWPPVDHPMSFWFVLAVMFLITIGMVQFFRRRKWL